MSFIMVQQIQFVYLAGLTLEHETGRNFIEQVWKQL